MKKCAVFVWGVFRLENNLTIKQNYLVNKKNICLREKKYIVSSKSGLESYRGVERIPPSQTLAIILSFANIGKQCSFGK